MILGIGTDIVAVSRFERWKEYPYSQLRKIFSEDELAQCRCGDSYDIQKLAARFAAKEAFFKALSASLIKLGYTQNEFTLLFACNHVSVERGTWDVPVLRVDWDTFAAKIAKTLPPICCELSFSHERDFSIAFVILSR